MSNNTGRVVATITVAEAFDLNQPQESAAAYHCIRVEPGVYPVELRRSQYDGVRYLVALFSGVVTHSGYGGRRYREREGTIDTVGLQPYKYQLMSGDFWGRVAVLDADGIAEARGV